MKIQISQQSKKLDFLLAVPYYVRLLAKCNTLENENHVLKEENKNTKNLIKSDLYKDFMAKLEAPNKIVELQSNLKLRTQQRNDLRTENLKQREEIKNLKLQIKEQDLVIKQRDKYKKQVKSLKEVIREAK